jgi:hypothetical protein
MLKEPTKVVTTKDQQHMKQHTGSVSGSLNEDGHNSRINIWNKYKDNIQTHMT